MSAFPVSKIFDPALVVNRLKAEKHERMVGVIGEKMVLKNFLEFVLLKEQVDPKFALVEKRVNFLFDVQLKRSEEEDSQRCWVKVEGNEDDIRRAKVRGWRLYKILLTFGSFVLFCTLTCGVTSF